MIGWFSCGVTSAVACHLSKDAELYYIKIFTAHPDNERFIDDFEKIDGRKINVVTSKYKDQFEVIEKERYINGPTGAACTKRLKINVREDLGINQTQVFGFTIEEKERLKLFKLRNPEIFVSAPLVSNQLSKKDCFDYLKKLGVKPPRMYELGYRNNNCIGCVKGGKGYWKKIRIDFPWYFDRMAKLERSLNRSCINGFFLDQLDNTPELFEDAECSLFCGQ